MKKIIGVLVMCVLMSASALAYKDFSLRSADPNIKLNIWSNGDKGQGTLEVTYGSMEYRYKLIQTSRNDYTYYGWDYGYTYLTYQAKVTVRNTETRKVDRYETVIKGFCSDVWGDNIYLTGIGWIPTENMR